MFTRKSATIKGGGWLREIRRVVLNIVSFVMLLCYSLLRGLVHFGSLLLRVLRAKLKDRGILF